MEILTNISCFCDRRSVPNILFTEHAYKLSCGIFHALLHIQIRMKWLRMHWLLGLLLQSHVKVNSWKTMDHLTWRCVATSYCNDVWLISSPKEMVLKDLIQNVHTLFDERPPMHPSVPLPDAPETTSAVTVDSFPSHKFLRSPEVQASPSSVAEWRLQVPPQLRLQPEVQTLTQSPPESVLSSNSDFPLSSATSLQTRMG